MKTPANKLVLFAALTVFAALGSACDEGTAKSQCDSHFETDAEVEACVYGATEVGPQSTDVKTAKQLCGAKYNLTQELQKTKNSADAMSRGRNATSLYVACDSGAQAHLKFTPQELNPPCYPHPAPAGTTQCLP